MWSLLAACEGSDKCLTNTRSLPVHRSAPLCSAPEAVPFRPNFFQQSEDNPRFVGALAALLALPSELEDARRERPHPDLLRSSTGPTGVQCGNQVFVDHVSGHGAACHLVPSSRHARHNNSQRKVRDKKDYTMFSKGRHVNSSMSLANVSASKSHDAHITQ